MLLSFDRVTKRFQRRAREIEALTDATFEVAQGDFLAVMGSARAGKTTLLRLAAGALLPDAGAVRFGGRVTTELSARELQQIMRHEIGCVVESSAGTLEREVVEFVSWPLISAGVSHRSAAARSREWLRRVGAIECAGAQLSELSASELTRVTLAQALIREPRLLLADEPCKTLDPIERDEILALLREAADSGVAVVMTAGDATRVTGATHFASLDRGRLLVEPREPAHVVELRREHNGRST